VVLANKKKKKRGGMEELYREDLCDERGDEKK
jgi:hypothetical protein